MANFLAKQGDKIRKFVAHTKEIEAAGKEMGIIEKTALKVRKGVSNWVEKMVAKKDKIKVKTEEQKKQEKEASWRKKDEAKRSNSVLRAIASVFGKKH